MTREEAKNLLPIIQAFAEGKTIQDWTNDTWKDKEYTSFGELSQSPIKPEPYYKPKPKYRPFKTKEECLNEMLKHQPFGWFRSTCNKNLFNTICIDNDGIKITNNLMKRMYSYSNAFSSIKFVDGSPFGIKE